MQDDQYDLFTEVKCSQCSKAIPRLDALKVCKHSHGNDITLYFCGEAEANEFYLERLRSTGL